MIIDLSTVGGYRIAGAIRGPDRCVSSDDYTAHWLKMFFTARIRDAVGVRDGLCWIRPVSSWPSLFRSDSSSPVDLRSIYDEAKSRKYYHYLIHVREALLTLKVRQISGELEMPDVDILLDACNILIVPCGHAGGFSEFETVVKAAEGLHVRAWEEIG